MQDQPLERLEEELARIPGVQSARVIGEDAPSEIHIVAAAGRPPKQLVRDVQSLAAAGFGMQIDHRIVSIVQLEESATRPGQEVPPARAEPDRVEGYRPVLERVVLASTGEEGWVKVALRWPDERVTEGVGTAGLSREARAKGAAHALLRALDPVLESRGARIEVEHVVLHRMGTMDIVAVRASFYRRGAVSPLVGAAVVRDDAASASVRALLHAINRKLES